jgi:hypothetical protein
LYFFISDLQTETLCSERPSKQHAKGNSASSLSHKKPSLGVILFSITHETTMVHALGRSISHPSHAHYSIKKLSGELHVCREMSREYAVDGHVPAQQ